MVINTKPHVALLASPGVGHLVPFLELAKRFVLHHHMTATLFVAVLENSPLDSELLNRSSLPPKHLLDVVFLPATVSHSAETLTILSQVCSMVRSIFPLLHSSLSKNPPTALMVDIFGMETFEIADEFDMKKYVFCTSNAWFLAETLYLPTLCKEIKPGEEMRIPGCKPIKYNDLLDPVWAWGKPDYIEYVRMGLEMATADGILINTWQDLEPSTIGALKSNKLLRQAFEKTPVHPIGPVSRLGLRKNINDDKLLVWLDEQPVGSVLYVSFGSGGTLSVKQTVELALGLELSQQRFIWVIRPPLDGEAAGSLFGSMDGFDEIARFVPDGFLTRTRDFGRVVPMWAPQAEILAHTSVGGFLTHCGWNSTLEALTNGVPMIAWPLYAEQNMNATLLTEEAKVAVRSEMIPTNEVVVGRVEIGRMVRKVIMQKDENGMKERATALQRSAEKAIGKGGSSCNALADVAKECESHALKPFALLN